MFRRLGQFVKRPLLAQRKGVISWPILVIIDSRSQLEHATKDKLEGGDDDVSRCEGSDFSNYELIGSTILSTSKVFVRCKNCNINVSMIT